MAVVDAAIVEHTVRPRCQVRIVAEDRAEGEASAISVSERFSAVLDASSTTKGSCARTGPASWSGFVALATKMCGCWSITSSNTDVADARIGQRQIASKPAWSPRVPNA